MDTRSTAAIATGGALGALCRWGLVEALETGGTWPWPVLVVNLAGCGLLGWLWTVRHRAPPGAWLAATTGFCGALTTFSAFAVDASIMLRGDDYADFASYTVASVVGGVALFAATVRLGARRITR